MNGAAHYRKAEELLDAVSDLDSGDVFRRDATAPVRIGATGIAVDRAALIGQAQVHATLAQAAATALSGVISNNLSAGSAINDLAHDSETLTAINDWHEAAARRSP
ncbi:hypothetical protein PP483_gp48 [Gordonia phage Bunnybear]|uniref:Uncharacterized protein n=1 Tax=Gordonia phage Bunnybear TaxID=2762398 RepID=A0A7G8LLI2_9CAUD|nr:hypothetical protein PP483_gp48 [Gordonia phage Bunnybear]QNJ58104.1 hypothetical protein SEA_BUNNYBEAR_48 [Gordonia phage Bunnybear]